jgi:hypothetical protein
MLDREGRLRVVGVAVLAVAVMGGVVASALVARAKGHAEDAEIPPEKLALERPGAGVSSSAYGPTRPDRDHAMPSGCEVDPASPPAARFELKDDVLDLGTVRQGVQITKDVTIRNAGKGVLCVDEPTTGCGCVQAKLVGEKKIPPTESAAIRITVDTTSREGHQEKDVRLATNDPARKEAIFKVVLEVKQGILVVSASTGLYFGQHAPGNPGEIVVRLKSPRGDPPWTVSGVEGQRTAFTWSAEEDVEPNDPVFRHVDVTIRHPGALEPTLHHEDVKIRTTNAERPEIVIHTQLLVVKKYYAGPERLVFGTITPTTASRPRTVTIKAGEEHTDLRVTGARLEGKGFTVGAPRRVTEGWAVDVAYDGAARKEGALEAELVVTLDDAQVPELRIPVRATIVGS